VKEAIPIVRTIIYELELAIEEKTIKPINAGGVAVEVKNLYIIICKKYITFFLKIRNDSI